MISALEEKADKLLRAAKLKRTISRRGILEVLLSGSRAQSAEEIAVRIGRSGPNKVTIYRTLETLVARGIVHKAYIRERTVYFELGDRCTAEQCHPHFVCTSCGDVFCLPGLLVPAAGSPGEGYVIHRQQTKLEGLCPRCSVSG